MKTIKIEHDGLLFFTSDYQINCEGEYIACYFSYSIGIMYLVKKNSIYGEILLKLYKDNNFTSL